MSNLFRVYLNTTAGRKSLECCAGSPAEASAKGRKLYEGAIVVKVKAISGYTLPAPPEMTQELPEPVRFAHAGPNLQQMPKRTPEGAAIREAAIEWLHVDFSGANFEVIERRIAETHGVPAELHHKTT